MKNWLLTLPQAGKSKVKADAVPAETSLPGVQMATLLLCPHNVASALSLLLFIRVLIHPKKSILKAPQVRSGKSLWTREPCLWRGRPQVSSFTGNRKDGAVNGPEGFQRNRKAWRTSWDKKLKLGGMCMLSPVTLCDPMDYGPSGSSVHGILQARILEWVAIPFSRGSSQPRDWTQVSCIASRFFTLWATREALTNLDQLLKAHFQSSTLWE